MIEGKKINKNGEKEYIKSDNLRYAFGLFNAAIEACYNQKNKTTEIALGLDTNNIISAIYNSINKNKTQNDIYNVNQPGNPLDYYKNIVNYLNMKNINILELYTNKSIENKIFLSIISKENNSNKFKELKTLPDIVVLNIIDNANINEVIPYTFNLNNDKSKGKYALDSAVVRDINKQHFCSLITLNNKKLGYDGASFTRLNNFDWKKYINKDINWSFKGSVFKNNNKQIFWNFKKGYSMLFYYRVK